jgi:cytochrome b
MNFETIAQDSARAEGSPERRVWDLPVRLFHWTLVTAVIGEFVTNKAGVAYFKYHLWLGYLILVLVGFRIIWGFVGTRNALFRNFIKGPITTARYGAALLAGKAKHYTGHNPLGALMVVFLLGGLGVQAALGLVSNDDIFNNGPLAGYVTKETSQVLTSIHRNFFYALAAAVALHVGAVLFHRFVKGENLVRAMLTGTKPADVVPLSETISGSRVWLALIIVIALGGGLAYVVTHAPTPVVDTEF